MEYMSQEGWDKLVAELKQLETVDLPACKDAISEARDKGDLSENFEYHAAKREHGQILWRIHFLQKILSNARVMPASQMETDTVQSLTKVELLNVANNKTMTYTIVSPHEANTRERKISVKSPIAKALLNRKKGEVVEVHVPVGLIKLKIVNISR